MNQTPLEESKRLRDALLSQLKARRVAGVESVAIGGGDDDLVLIVDVNALYRGGVPDHFGGHAVETAKFGTAFAASPSSDEG